jgi:hypothetical protein
MIQLRVAISALESGVHLSADESEELAQELEQWAGKFITLHRDAVKVKLDEDTCAFSYKNGYMQAVKDIFGECNESK